jgi:hypothetical protein
VFGGKIDEFVVQFFRMFTSEPGVPDHRLQVNFLQATCFSHPIALDDMFEKGNNGFFRQSRVEKNRSPMLRELLFANQAV